MAKTILLGDVRVGSDHPPVFFAEIGSFFNGNAALARSMMEQVIACCQRAPQRSMVLKTEILDDPDICLPVDTEETYTCKGGAVRKERYRELIERKAMPLAEYAELFRLCTGSGVPFVVSVYDFKAADFAAQHGAAALKIASSNVVHVPLIRHAARLGLPLVIDTGRTTIAEVHRAVDTARAAGCQDLIIQHSPDGHPAPPKAHNLRILQTYQNLFGMPTGLSDHYVGVEMLYVAVALGASVLEKGVYLDPDELDQDISHTMALADLPRVAQMVYDCWLALGQPLRDVRAPIDWVIGTSQRQCLVAKRELRPGDRIGLETIRFAFPCKGIPVEQWDLVDGWVVKERVPANQPIQWPHVQRQAV